MLEAYNLRKIYHISEKMGLFRPKKKKDIVAVNNISLKIKPGQIVGLLGINGAGKTTTIKMLSSLLEPTSGSFMIDQIDGVKYPQRIKKIVNVITGGERNIYWRLTAKENLEYFGALYNIPKKKLDSQINDLIKLVGLMECADMPVERYSKGMKQRLQIARGLINDPKYLFLDEPTLGLDITIAKELRGYIRSIATEQRKGIMLTTHYISEVEELCDWVYVIDNGSVITEGTSEELIRTANIGMNISILINELPNQAKMEIEKIARVKGGLIKFEKNEDGVLITISVRENLVAQLVQILINNGLAVLNLNTVEPRLEDALIKLAGGGNDNE